MGSAGMAGWFLRGRAMGRPVRTFCRGSRIVLLSAGEALKTRQAFKTGVQQKIVNFAFTAVLLQKPENELRDGGSNKAGKDSDQKRKENIGRIMRHQVIA